ncbi:hypothetical protein [Pseudomonas sp. RW405]|uniref:hypothetical protein n=1 Tax=Pseudomonas sp. RW405 TaxID=2202652 RepID=UPI0011B8110C|nr:hypothetical protein [Pseudomonas sp. RW405]
MFWSSFLSSTALLLLLAAKPALALEVKMDVHASGGSYPVISGLTNLPDGTELSITLVVPGEYLGQGKAIVENGRFASEAFSNNGKPLPSGVANLEVNSVLASSEKVRAVIGEHGEKMTGPHVTTLAGTSFRTVHMSSKLAIP